MPKRNMKGIIDQVDPLLQNTIALKNIIIDINQMISVITE